MNDQEAIREQLTTLTEHFAAELPAMLQRIESLWSRVGRDAPGAGRELSQLAHQLAGSGASLGFNRIGLVARGLEQLLAEGLRTDGLAGRLDQLSTQVERLKEALREERAGDAAALEEKVTALAATPPSLHEARSGRLVYLVEDDPHQASELAAQIGYFGYTVKPLTHLADLGSAIDEAVPAVVLMDIIFPEGEMAGIEAMAALQRSLPEPLPVIFVSVTDNLEARLHAVRAGSRAYFTKPVDVVTLIDAIDRLTTSEVPFPYRICIVDDSRVHASFNAMQLKKAGMKTQIVTDPFQLMSVLTDFNPDLILLDMYMPECTGMELAQVIRQMEHFISIPIVYLSGETDKVKQLEAISLGADDFLTKPIEPSHLIAAVTSRVERYRKLRCLMLRDGLTGLLNHTTTKERLNQELSRAQRQDCPLAFAMLDLDHFKSVNDTYGHGTGDRVLKSLAHLLIRRLRSTDIVGRYGGEEFAVILPNTSGEAAERIMEELREGFAKVRHGAGGEEFSVTFSCGVASYPECGSSAALSSTADQALYAAKHQGRNRVVLDRTVG